MATAIQADVREKIQKGPKTVETERIVSLDIMRGFDMFWISGGDDLVKALAKATGWAWAVLAAGQLEHVEWAGFHFYDLIFPMFIFISGVTLPIAMGRRVERGQGRGRIVLKLFGRALILFALGLLYNNGPVTFDVQKIRFCSVLGRIGFAGLGAGLIVLFARPRIWLWWIAGLLIGYWALLTFVPIPGQGAPSYEIAKNWPDYLDRLLLPGRFIYKFNHEPQGILSTFPSVALALLGALAGFWLTTTRAPWRKALGLLGAGVLLVAMGWGWSYQFPIIKHLWTSSFILLTAGLSCLILSVFYAVVDGLRLRAWGFPFLLIGMNPLTLYVLKGTGLIDFAKIGKFFFGFALDHADKIRSPWAPVYGVLATIAIELLFLLFLYRKKIFLRV